MAQHGPEAAIRAFYDSWNVDGVASLAATSTEDLTWHDDPSLPDASVHDGRGAVATRLGEFVEAMGHFQVEVTELGQLDDGRRYAVISVSVEGEGSGVAITDDHLHVLRVADDRLAEVWMYTDAAQARRELGLDGVPG